MKNNFAIYRHPGSSSVSLVECGDEALLLSPSVKDTGNADGFVIAPFAPNLATPVVTVTGKPVCLSFNDIKILSASIKTITAKQPVHHAIGTGGEIYGKRLYEKDFESFHRLVGEGRAGKIVLARSMTMPADTPADPLRMFAAACEANPNCFVALFNTAPTGMWITATPEILLERTGGECHTMALAGTVPFSGDTGQCEWSVKNRAEQRYVADYIRNVIKGCADSNAEDGPYTFPSGNIAHLRTDFRFHTKDGISPGDIIQCLHPTPAVCGFPKELCRQFILANESNDREYYSGFCGPVSRGGDIHLYVTLRCMKINDNAFTLYAGGGILPDSRMEEEWNETVYKMQAMKACIEEGMKQL